MTASVTHGRALRYAEGSARGLLHHYPGHSQFQVRVAVLNGFTALGIPVTEAMG